MPCPSEDQAFRERIRRVETLLEEMEQIADPAVRSHVQELVQTLLEYHGAGLARLVDHVAQAGEAGQALLATLARDDLVSSLFLLYGLHPLDFETRVRLALDKVAPALRAHGGTVELVDTAAGVVRLRVQTNGHACQSSSKTLKTTLEGAIYGAAPEVAGIEVEGLASPTGAATTFVSVEELLATAGRRSGKVTIS